MMHIDLTTEQLKKFKPYITNSREGNIYHYEQYLYKIFNKDQIKEKESIIDVLLNIEKIDHCIMPINKIFVDNEFAGISINYLEKYKTLNQTLHSKKIDFKTRLQICRYFIETIKKLYNMGICYDDVDLNNIIMHKSDVQLVDMDDVSIKGLISDKEYKISKQLMQFNSAILVLSYLYHIDLHEQINRYQYDFFNVMLYILGLDSEIRSYLSDLMANKDVGNIYIDKYFDVFDEDKIKSYTKGYVNYFISKK